MDLVNHISSFTGAHAQTILEVGKIVMALIMLFMSAVGLLIVFNFVVWQRKLQAMELSAQQTADEVMIILTEARATLVGLGDLLRGLEATLNARALLLSGSRLAMLLLRRERSLISWSTLGLKVAGNAVRYFLTKR